MVAKPGSLAPHSLIKWTWSGVKLSEDCWTSQADQECLTSWPGWEWKFPYSTRKTLFRTMLSSRNPAVSFIATKALHNTVGILGRNRAFLTIKYQDGRLIRDLLIPLQRTLGSGDAPRVEQIRELIRERDGSGVIENFQLEEVILVLDYVSTYWCLCVFFH